MRLPGLAGGGAEAGGRVQQPAGHRHHQPGQAVCRIRSPIRIQKSLGFGIRIRIQVLKTRYKKVLNRYKINLLFKRLLNPDPSCFLRLPGINTGIKLFYDFKIFESKQVIER